MFAILHNYSGDGKDGINSCGDGSSSDTLAIEVDDCPGINDITDIVNIVVKPNPVKNRLVITSDATIESVSIYSFSGKQVVLNRCKSTTVKMNVSDLPNGIYLVKISTNRGIKTTKLVKK